MDYQDTSTELYLVLMLWVFELHYLLVCWSGTTFSLDRIPISADLTMKKKIEIVFSQGGSKIDLLISR